MIWKWIWIDIPPETNIALENQWLEDECPLVTNRKLVPFPESRFVRPLSRLRPSESKKIEGLQKEEAHRDSREKEVESGLQASNMILYHEYKLCT